MNKQLKGFMDFVRAHGVVGLAVGLAIGTQVGKVVEVIVKGLIDPLVGLLVGNQEGGLQAAKFTLTIGSRYANFMWGSVLSAIITLLAVSAVIYWSVNGLKLDKIDKPGSK
jgi:large conductance mechanosensitive channel